MMTFADLTHALDTTGIMFTPYEWDTPPQNMDAWGTVLIGTSNVLYGGDCVAEEFLAGTIQMCTRVLDSTAFNAVTAVLRRLMEEEPVFSFKMTGVRFDRNERVIYYSWRWSGAILTGFE